MVNDGGAGLSGNAINCDITSNGCAIDGGGDVASHIAARFDVGVINVGLIDIAIFGAGIPKTTNIIIITIVATV